MVFDFVRKTFKSSYDFAKKNAEKLVDEIENKVEHSLNDISDLGIKSIGKSLKVLGINDTLDKYWQKYGRPVFKFGNGIVSAIKKKFKNNVPYLDEIIVLLRVNPKFNKIISSADTLDQLLTGLADNDWKKVGRIATSYGSGYSFAKALPTSKRVHYLQWVHKYAVKDGVALNGLEEESKKLSSNLNARGGNVSIDTAKKMINKAIVGL